MFFREHLFENNIWLLVEALNISRGTQHPAFGINNFVHAIVAMPLGIQPSPICLFPSDTASHPLILHIVQPATCCNITNCILNSLLILSASSVVCILRPSASLVHPHLRLDLMCVIYLLLTGVVHCGGGLAGCSLGRWSWPVVHWGGGHGLLYTGALAMVSCPLGRWPLSVNHWGGGHGLLSTGLVAMAVRPLGR